MSELQKRIARVVRHEGNSFGFGARQREQPRALVLAALAANAKAAKAALDGGADAVIVRAEDATTAAAALQGLQKACAGAWLPGLDAAGAEALAAAGCDFVVSPLETTAAAAVNTDRMGHIVLAPASLSEAVLRALPPLGLDGLLVEAPTDALTLAGQLELVRLASFSGCPLLVMVQPGVEAASLRVLRDSGVVAVIAPADAKAGDLAALNEALRALPPRRRRDTRDIALVPSVAGHHHEDGEEDEPD
jgi:hypothetical protein